MEGLADRLITLGVVLGFWGICYIVRLFAGFKNVRKQMRQWNWSQFWDGVFDRFCWLVATGGAVVACEMLKWLMPSIGITFSPEITLLLDTASVIAIPFVNGVADLVLGIRSIQASSGWENNVKALEANVSGDIDYAKIGQDVREFIDTIVPKTSKEDFEDSLEIVEGEVVDVLDYEVVEAGKGGVADTYPNAPKTYRTSPQDSIIDPSTCYNRECVSYCAAKIYEVTGKWPTRTGGMNAKYWVQRLAENGYTKVVDRPANGGKYVGVSDKGQYGHVVWFEEGSTISEYNYLTRGGFSVRNIDLGAYKWVEIKPASIPAPAPAVPDKKPTKSNPAVYYTYKQGDTFGQVIKDLGLATSNGLWGSNGDVAYYTEQLRSQGITGNIPVGTTIKLVPRK